jgi:hypothetical protein
MAHLWVQESNPSAWRVVPLRCSAYALTEDRMLPAEADFAAGGDAELHDIGGLWVLTAAAAVRVNGTPVFGGLRALRDRDELRIGRRHLFFSTEELPRVVAFAGAAEPVPCGRCRQPLASGDASVRCRCGVWHHQTDDLPCWTYASHCALCDQTTALDGSYRWSPALL